MLLNPRLKNNILKPRPKTKTELLTLSQKNYDRLIELIDQMNKQEQLTDFAPGTMNRNIRDVIAHLHHWHLMMLNWYTIGMKGEKPAMPAKGYSWKTVPAFNQWIWEKYNKITLDDAYEMFRCSYKKVRKIIEKHSNEELFEKKRYPWTGSTSLGSYLVSATSSHYDWAYKLIKNGKKQKL